MKNITLEKPKLKEENHFIPGMNKLTSLYLDLIRGLAAIAVPHIPQVKLLSRYFQRSVNSYSDSFNLHSQLLSFTENKCGSLSNSLTF